jgi:hypothetical protein
MECGTPASTTQQPALALVLTEALAAEDDGLCELDKTAVPIAEGCKAPRDRLCVNEGSWFVEAEVDLDVDWLGVVVSVNGCDMLVASVCEAAADSVAVTLPVDDGSDDAASLVFCELAGLRAGVCEAAKNCEGVGDGIADPDLVLDADWDRLHVSVCDELFVCDWDKPGDRNCVGVTAWLQDGDGE